MAITPPQGVAASRGGIKIAISKSPVYDTLVVREDVPVWVKALAPKAEIDLEKMTFGSVPVDGTLAVEGLSPDGATMFVVTRGFVTVSTTYGDGKVLESRFSAGQVFFLQGVDGFKHTFSVSETKWPLEYIAVQAREQLLPFDEATATKKK